MMCDLEKNPDDIQSRVALYRCAVNISNDLKELYFEKLDLMEEMKKNKEKLKLVEDELEMSRKQMADNKTSLTLKIVEMEKKMSDRIKENDSLRILVNVNKETISSLEEENRCIKEEVVHYRNTIDHIMKEREEEQKINSDKIDLLEKEISSSKALMNKLKGSINSSFQWLLHFGLAFTDSGILNKEKDMEYKAFFNFTERVQKYTQGDDASDICSFFDSLKLPHPSLHAHLVSRLEARKCAKDINFTSESTQTEHAIDPIPHETSAHELPFAPSDNEVELQNSPLPDENNFPASSPVHIRKIKFRTPESLKRSQSTTDHFCTPSKRKKAQTDGHGNTFNAQSADIQPKDENVPSIVVAPKDDDNEILITFSLNKQYKQCVNLTYVKNEVTVGYKQCLPAQSAADAEISSHKHSVEGDFDERSNAGDTSVSLSDSSFSATENSCLSAGTSSAASVCIHPSKQICSPEVLSLAEEHMPPSGRNQDALGMIEDDNNDEEEEDLGENSESVIDLDSIPHEIADDATCSNIVSALETLFRINNDETAMKRSASRLKFALQNLDKLHESYAVQVTVNYICSRTSTPLQEYLHSNDPRVIFPLDELCIVKVYNTLGVPSLKDKLEKAVNDKLLKHSEDLKITGIAALCRVSASFKSLKNDVGKGRQLCHEVFKKFGNIAPFLVASIVSVFPEVLMQPSVKRSELRLQQAFCHLMRNKPNGLNEKLWDQTISYFKKNIKVEEIPSAERLIECTVADIMAMSSKDNFSDQDASNFCTVFQLITLHVEWQRIYKCIIEKRLIPFIEAFCTTTRKKLFSAAALVYKLLGILGCGHDINGVLHEFIMSTCTKLTSKKNNRVPDYIFEEIYYALERIKTGKEVIPKNEEGLKTWLKQHVLSKD